jgi:ubiquinone/menaquinone biosynthesis C-methylase UbiE
MNTKLDDVEWQRTYYSSTADKYDGMHDEHEHQLPLALLIGALDWMGVESVLDVGSGTGRAVVHIKSRRPEVRVVGLEPVDALREVGHLRGLSKNDLIAGDATSLPFANGEFDVVCAFGVLHHVKHPSKAVSEMLRTAKKAILISDANNFGQGSMSARAAKQAINALGLWRLADLIKTKGKGYTISEGDGLAYSYSVFNDYKQIRAACKAVHLMNTGDAGINPYRTATHVTLLGIKA